MQGKRDRERRTEGPPRPPDWRECSLLTSPTPNFRFETRNGNAEKASDFLPFSECGRGSRSPMVSEKERPRRAFQAEFGGQTGVARPHLAADTKCRKGRQLLDKIRPSARGHWSGERQFDDGNMVEEASLKNKPSPLVDEVREFEDECGWSRVHAPVRHGRSPRGLPITGSH